MIPMFMRLVVREDDGKGVNIWLPLFLIWILLLPLFVLLMTVWVFARLAAQLTHASGRCAGILEAAAALVWNMNGLRVDVHDRKSRFVLHF